MMLTCCLTLLPLAQEPAPNAASSADLARLLPVRSFAYAELPGFSELCAQGLEHPLIARVLDSPLGELLRREAPMEPEAALALADQLAGVPVLETLESLTARGVALSVGWKRGKPVVSLAARGDDPERWIDTLETVFERLAPAGLDPEHLAQSRRAIGGFDAWFVDAELNFALRDATFLLANDEGRLRDMIELAAGTGGNSLTTRDTFASARAARGSEGRFGWAWVDLAALEPLDPPFLRNLRRATEQPAPHFLLGSTLTFLADARQATLALDVGDGTVELALGGFGVDPDDAGAALLPPAGARGALLPAVTDGEVARLSVYRDLAALFRVRGELFPAGLQPRFAEATANLALFFGGEDVSDSVLPGLDPWLGVVVREPRFDAASTPDLVLPGAALVARLDDPELGERLVAAFQTFIGVINVDSAQKMQPTLMLGLEQVGENTLTTARFRKPAAGEGVDVRYNLVPACCVVGDSFVIGTHASVVREVVDQLAHGEIEPAAGERLALDGSHLLRALEAGRAALIANAVLNEGKTPEQARGEIEGLAQLLALLESVELIPDRDAGGAHFARLRVELASPREAREDPGIGR